MNSSEYEVVLVKPPWLQEGWDVQAGASRLGLGASRTRARTPAGQGTSCLCAAPHAFPPLQLLPLILDPDPASVRLSPACALRLSLFLPSSCPSLCCPCPCYFSLLCRPYPAPHPLAPCPAPGALREESIFINKSLFTLRKVITMLTDQAAAAAGGRTLSLQHIPYRYEGGGGGGGGGRAGYPTGQYGGEEGGGM